MIKVIDAKICMHYFRNAFNGHRARLACLTKRLVLPQRDTKFKLGNFKLENYAHAIFYMTSLRAYHDNYWRVVLKKD